MPLLARYSVSAGSGKRPAGHRYWHLIYYALAAMVVMTICGGLYLNQRMTGLYGQSVSTTQDHAAYLAAFLDLGDLAQQVNAPANDLFGSRSADREDARRTAALALFDQQLSTFRQQVAVSQAAPQAKFILRAVDQVAESMQDMDGLADAVFAQYRAGNVAAAAAEMAAMNRAYAVITRKIAEASRTVQDMQFAVFQDQLDSVERHTVVQYVVGTIIILIAAGVVFYGHVIRRAMMRAERDRQRLLEKLEQSEALATGRLHDAIESVDEGFVLYDRDDRLVLCNSRYKQMYALSGDLIVPGASFEDALRQGLARGQYADGNMDSAWLQRRLEIHRSGNGAMEQKLADGRWLLVTDRRTRDGGIVGIRTDITDRKRAEVALRETNDRLSEANDSLKDAMAKLSRQERLATLGQLAGTVSHELRNPLAAIQASTELIRHAIADKTLNLGRVVDRIERNIRRCTDLVNDLLDYARQKDLQRKPTDIDPWLDELLDEHEIDPAVSVVRDLRAAASVGLDQDRFRQVVVNLVDNAAQAMLDPGWTPPADRPRRLTVRTEAAGPHVRLSVVDTGPGIADDKRSRIFEPLFTTKGFGVGLGLAIVQQIVEQHGGTIHVDSSPDGSCFTVYLPRPAMQQEQAA